MTKEARYFFMMLVGLSIMMLSVMVIPENEYPKASNIISAIVGGLIAAYATYRGLKESDK